MFNQTYSQESAPIIWKWGLLAISALAYVPEMAHHLAALTFHFHMQTHHHPGPPLTFLLLQSSLYAFNFLLIKGLAVKRDGDTYCMVEFPQRTTDPPSNWRFSEVGTHVTHGR